MLLNRKVLFILTLVIPSLCFAQQEKKQRWGVFMGVGLALPIGDFNKIAPEQAVTFSAPFYYFSGFKREGNSAAKNGSFFSIGVNYRPLSWLKIAGTYGRTSNGVNDQPVTDYLNTVLPRTSQDGSTTYYQYVTSSDYVVNSATISFEYQYTFKKIEISAGPTLGIYMLDFPDYNKSTIYTTTKGTTNDSLKDMGAKPTNSSTAMGVVASLTYRLTSKVSASVELAYASTDFNYSITLQKPGFNPTSQTDKISYRVMQLGIKAGYMF